MNWADLLDRLVWLAAGGALGFALGWASRARRMAGQALRKVREMEHQRDEHGRTSWSWNTWSTVTLGILVIVVAASATFTGIQAGRLRSTQDQVRAGQVCSQRVLAHVVRSLTQRTSYSGRINHADRQQNEAFAGLVKASLVTPPVSEARARAITRAYSTKLNRYLHLLAANDRARVRNPYPNVDDYRACLRAADSHAHHFEGNGR